MRRSNVLLAGLAALSLCSSGCMTRRLPPPAPPAPVLPELPIAGPMSAERGRVILDVPGESAIVEAVDLHLAAGGHISASGQSATGDQISVSGSSQHAGVLYRRLCRTPCIVDLALGPHELQFVGEVSGGRSSDFINVTEGTTAMRHALGRSEARWYRQLYGWPILATAGLTGVQSVALLTSNEESNTAAIGLGAVTAGLAILGYWLVETGRPVEQPGSTTMWRLD